MAVDMYSDPELYDSGRIGFDEELLRNLNIREGSTVMEIGCGNGRFLKALHRKDPTLKLSGLDYSEVGIEQCKREIEGDFYQADIRRFETDRKYDYVLCFQTLEHFQNPHIVLSKLRRLGGDIYISVPNANLDLCEDHLQFWTIDTFHQSLLYHFTRVFTNLIDGDQNILASCRI